MDIKSLDIIKGKEISDFTYLRYEDGRVDSIEIHFSDNIAVRIDVHNDCILWVGYWDGDKFDCLND